MRATGVCHRHRRNGHPLCRPLDRRDRSSIRCCTIVFRRPPQAHHAFALRADGCMARFTAPHALSSRGDWFSIVWHNRARRAYAPPMPCAGVVFPSHDREADPRDVPVAARSMRPRCFSRCLEGSGVVDRSAETAAFSSPREGRKTRSIRDVFHRTISPERRFVAEDALDAVALFHSLSTMKLRAGFLTSPRRIYTGLRRSRLGPADSCARRLAAP